MILVFGLNSGTDEKALRYEFSKYADVRYVKLVKDYEGRSRGFGFVTFYDTKDATTVSLLAMLVRKHQFKQVRFRRRRC